MTEQNYEPQPGGTPIPDPQGASDPSASRPDPRRQRRDIHEQQPTRRVGTLTMGLALIVAGIVALVAMFFPGFDLTAVFKLSPLIFVFLGVEILLSNFRFKGYRLKYDLLSGFVCFLLILAAGCMAALPSIWNYWGPPAMEARDNLDRQVRDRLNDSLRQDTGLIERLYVNTELPYYKQYTPGMSFEDLSQDMRVHLHFALKGPYDGRKAFAADCHRLLSKVDALHLNIRNLTLNYSDEKARYELDFYDEYSLALSTDELSARVEETLYGPEDGAGEDGEPVEAGAESYGRLPAEEGFTDEWPDFITRTADGMTAHSYYFDLPVDGAVTCELTASVTSGRMSVQIAGEDGAVCLEDTELPQGDGALTFALPSAGTYTVRLTADDFHGSFTINNLG